MLKDETKDADPWGIWQKLHKDDAFNIGTSAHVLLQGANDVSIPQPNLNYSLENTRITLRRYRGTNEEAEADSHKQIGLHQVVDRYYARLRAA